ncbi:DUF4249 domain-containing protein [Pedobacter foliorum]|uniref:DUF4249 domain-containing protein n=1 Tax=Pedobacter foliorum TaxID=2739058 RepID=UPI0015634F2E|nr:DUF4249 domain-containing protein [Pedobacter foliorum]NRF38525.1 DUF4249 domain-containing protein [Pedobacter foliorum]
MKKYFLFYMCLVLWSCKKPYTPEVITKDVNYLVVEGFINAGGDSTIITLSRTSNLTDTQSKPELHAIVVVEGDDNKTYNIGEKGNGKYGEWALPIGNPTKYRLKIITTNGNIYLSDFVEPKISPKIDDISWDIKPDGLQINASSHDVNNNSRYYRFEYDQTWQFVSNYFSSIILKGDKLVKRNPDTEDIYSCFGNDHSSQITVASTARLTNDILSKAPILFIRSNEEKLSIKYSILLKQYTMSEKEYKYWETLKKNTENLGSIFDPQPSFVLGNLKCTNNPDEKVLGYIGAGSASTKRIFIDKAELPQTWEKEELFTCKLDSLHISETGVIFNNPNKATPVYAVYGFKGFVEAYYVSSVFCVDCTTRGTKTKPNFWPQ